MISVIVPVYNVGKYIGECIESILKQTYKDWELILVVDGATDNSADICNHYKNTDSRIKVIEKPNGGVSSARNAGIKAATGDYIMFVDGDDWVEPDILEVMHNCIKENQVDACYCHIYYKENEIEATGIPNSYINKILKSEDALRMHLKFCFVASPCFSLTVRAKVADLFFNEQIHTYEDWEYNFRQLYNLDSLYVLDKAFYHYRTVAGSASKSELNNRKLTCFQIVDEVKLYVEKNNLPYNTELKVLNVHFLYHMLVILANGKYNKEPAKELCRQARKILFSVLTSKTMSSKKKLYTLMTAIHPRLFCVAYKLKYRV